VNIDIKVAEKEAMYFVPENRFKELRYSDVRVGKCYGTLAFHCRKWKEDTNYEVDQSSCPSCRDDWKAIHNDCLPIDHEKYKNLVISKRQKQGRENNI
jgi:MinD superfamily P-loop ATPase